MSNSLKCKSLKKRNLSGSAQCDICGKTDILERHHINGRNIPHYNKKSNVTDICPSCHRHIHAGYIIVEEWVMTTSGRTLLWHKNGEESFTGRDSSPYIHPK